MSDFGALALDLGGYASAVVLDDGFYFYMLVPPTAFVDALAATMREFFSTVITEERFLSLRQRLYRDSVAAVKSTDTNLPRYFFTRRFPAFAGESTLSRATKLSSLSYQDYVAYFLEPAQSYQAIYGLFTASEQLCNEAKESLVTLLTKQTIKPANGYISSETKERMFCRQDQNALGVGYSLGKLSLSEELPLLLFNYVTDMRPGRGSHAYLHSGPQFAYWSVISRPTSGKGIFSSKDIAREVIRCLKDFTPPAQLVEYARNILEKRFLEESEGALGRASVLTELALRDGEVNLDYYLDQIRSVNEDDVRARLATINKMTPEFLTAASDWGEAKHLLTDFSRYFNSDHKKTEPGSDDYWSISNSTPLLPTNLRPATERMPGVCAAREWRPCLSIGQWSDLGYRAQPRL